MASKRLNKRQAREQQELEELAAAKAVAPSAAVEGAESEEEEEASPAPAKPAAASIFAALNAGEDGDDSEGDDDDEAAEEEETVAAPTTKKKKNKKKKKKSKAAKPAGEGEEGQDGEAASAVASAAPAASSKKNKKAGGDKTANATAKGISDMSLDDFDSLLSSQPHMKAGGSASTGASAAGPSSSTPSSSSPSSSLRSSLSLSPSHLDPSVELKRQFGSAAIKAFEASNGGTDGEGGGGGAGAGRAARGTRARMMARNPNLKARSILVQPREDWPPIARTFTGIQGETQDDQDGDGEKVATWTHSKSYLTAQYEFQAAVATYDPNSLYALFRPYPWHIHLLSSLSDIARHQGDLSQAADWNARIIFAFERTAAPQWVGSLTGPSGPMRVDFDRVENRALWLAAHRNVGFLGRRGTWRTALEWAKLMLALDPRQDPHGALLWIDFLAVKSGQHAWFVDEFLPALEKGGSNARNWLGGLAFAEALAVRAIEADAAKKKNSSAAAAARRTSAPTSTELLKRAITQHPYMLPALASKLSLPPLPPSLANVEVDGVHEILAQLYALRSGESLWKDAENKEWLSATLRDFESGGGKGQPQQPPAQPSDKEAQGIYRHVIASDLPDTLRTSLLSCLPRAVGRDEANLNAHDPLPPPKTKPGVTRIDEDYFAPMFRTTGGASGPSGARGAAGSEGQDDSEIGEGIMNRLAAFAAGRLRGWFQQQEGGGGEENAGQEEGAQGDMQDALMAALGSLPEAEREAMRRIIEEGAAGMGGPHGEGHGSEGSEDEGDEEEEYEEVLSSEDEERR